MPLPGQEASHGRTVGPTGPAGPTISLLLLNAGDWVIVIEPEVDRITIGITPDRADRWGWTCTRPK
jgi:hypothetical protein